MKVNIGPYRNWFGPYQFAYLFKYLGFSQDTCHKIGDRIPAGPFNWIYSKKKRKINIHIDDYDVWNADHTLALIILPVLVKLKEVKHGSPCVDNEDVPEEIAKLDVHQKWNYVLDEIIWTFEQLADPDKEYDLPSDRETQINYSNRITNGLILFGKYYRGLWD